LRCARSGNKGASRWFQVLGKREKFSVYFQKAAGPPAQGRGDEKAVGFQFSGNSRALLVVGAGLLGLEAIVSIFNRGQGPLPHP